MIALALIASSTSPVTWIPLVIGVLLGLAGVVGWLTGTVRKSVNEAQRADIAAMDHRIVTLEAENKALEESNLAKSQALTALIEEHRGKAELTQFGRDLALLVNKFDQFDRTLDNLKRTTAKIARNQMKELEK